MNLRRITSLELTLLKEGKGDQLENSYSTFEQVEETLLSGIDYNFNTINDVRQTEIHTVEPSAFQVGIAIEKLKRFYV